jgi:ferredoxin-NADP reductase
MSMIRYGVAVGLDVPMRLVCSSPDFGHAFYHQELVDLAERCRWLEVVHCFTRDPSDPRAVHHRRIDRIMMAEAVAGRPPRRVYICGPPGMVEDVQGWLGDVDVDPARVRSEKYD